MVTTLSLLIASALIAGWDQLIGLDEKRRAGDLPEDSWNLAWSYLPKGWFTWSLPLPNFDAFHTYQAVSITLYGLANGELVAGLPIYFGWEYRVLLYVSLWVGYWMILRNLSLHIIWLRPRYWRNVPWWEIAIGIWIITGLIWLRT